MFVMINFELWNSNAPPCIIRSINSLQAAWLKFSDKKKVTWNTNTFNIMIFSIFYNQIGSFPRKWQTFFLGSIIGFPRIEAENQDEVNTCLARRWWEK